MHPMVSQTKATSLEGNERTPQNVTTNKIGGDTNNNNHIQSAPTTPKRSPLTILRPLPEVVSLRDCPPINPVREQTTQKMDTNGGSDHQCKRTKGLLQRRGSNASLTISLYGTSMACAAPSPETISHVAGSSDNAVLLRKPSIIRRKSLSNENLYVPPPALSMPVTYSQRFSLRSHSRKTCHPLSPAHITDDFKLHLQNIQYLQAASNVLSVEGLKTACDTERVPKIHAEFWEVPLNLQEKCYVSGSQSKNRYRSVLPNEHSRVRLTGNNGNDYIHANYIKGPDYVETKYIATQGPMNHTCESFWEMVWCCKCESIVMLTDLVENGRSKCELYFPMNELNNEDKDSTPPKCCRATFGTYTITLIEAINLSNDWSLRILQIQNDITEETRQLRHYWYMKWQDHKIPNPQNILNMALHLLSNCGSDANDNNNGNSDKIMMEISDRIQHFEFTTDLTMNMMMQIQVVVHCSAGIGRTGCFLAILNGIQQLRVSRTCDILAILCSLRLNRGGMVQTAEQYELIHRVLKLYATTSNSSVDSKKCLCNN